MIDKRYYTIKEAATILNLAPATIRRMFDNGQLQGFRIPGGNHRRISRASVIDLLHKQEPQPEPES
jgi:excisionase family DNA binding protein